MPFTLVNYVTHMKRTSRPFFFEKVVFSFRCARLRTGEVRDISERAVARRPDVIINVDIFEDLAEPAVGAKELVGWKENIQFLTC